MKESFTEVGHSALLDSKMGVEMVLKFLNSYLIYLTDG